MAPSWSGWTKIQQTYEYVQPNLALVELLERTEAECGKGLFFACTVKQ